MHQSPSVLFIQRLVLAFLSVFSPLAAQNSAPTTTPTAHLEQLNSTYLTNLQKYHGPIIQDYLRELIKLKQSFVARSRNTDAALVQSEIDKFKKLASASGIFPYDSLNTPTTGQPTEETPVKKMDAAIVLVTGTETRSSPDRSTLKEKPTGKALPIGVAEWKVEKITAGNYRVAMLYSCPNITEGVVITAKISATSIERKLTSEDNTGGINEFRFARIGSITIDQELTKEHFVLQSSDPSKAAVWVRQIVLTKIKTTENK